MKFLFLSRLTRRHWLVLMGADRLMSKNVQKTDNHFEPTQQKHFEADDGRNG